MDNPITHFFVLVFALVLLAATHDCLQGRGRRDSSICRHSCEWKGGMMQSFRGDIGECICKDVEGQPFGWSMEPR